MIFHVGRQFNFQVLQVIGTMGRHDEKALPYGLRILAVLPIANLLLPRVEHMTTQGHRQSQPKVATTWKRLPSDMPRQVAPVGPVARTNPRTI
jgi:hypothetical protein